MTDTWNKSKSHFTLCTGITRYITCVVLPFLGDYTHDSSVSEKFVPAIRPFPGSDFHQSPTYCTSLMWKQSLYTLLSS